MPDLSFDTTLLFQNIGVTHGISSTTISSTQTKIAKTIEIVDQKILNHELGFVEALSSFDISIYEKALKDIDWADTLVVVGIGGSDLGCRTLMQALSPVSGKTIIFHGDSTDPVAIEELLKKINLQTTVFNVISKSGETLETISQYLFLKQLLKEETSHWAKHFIFTTSAEHGVLQNEAKKNQIALLPIPENVGGRFSVLTSVGLFPALVAGIDIEALVEGGKAAMSHQKKISQQIAVTQYQLFSQDIKIAVMMTYAVQLEEFGRWFRQLWAESLGKDETGILPIQARGPADQHSQSQFYHQGVVLSSLLFLIVDQPKIDFLIEDVDIPSVSYLGGRHFRDLLHAEQLTTALSLFKAGRPTSTLILSKITPYTMGELFMVFELAVVYLAEMLGVNAFDQPGVEEGKQLLAALLEKPGTEQKQAELIALVKKTEA